MDTTNLSAVIVHRNQLRKDKLELRLNMSPNAHEHASAEICNHLHKILSDRAATTIAWCAPIKGECNIYPLIKKLTLDGWQAVIPVIVQRAKPLAFHSWAPSSVMRIDRYGIPVPAHAQVAAKPEIMLIPLVAFDEQGYRLGYGGGYFDRTLAALKSPVQTIGVGFESARTATVFPQPYDIPLSIIATECVVRYPAKNKS